MSLSTRVNEVHGELLQKVILQNDLGSLSPVEKVQHVKNVCESLGLNPLTKPIQLIKFEGNKEIMYMSKDGAEQIRNLHEVSIINLETEILNGDLYVVKAYASKPSGRQDCSTSAISISGLKGVAIGNAMKKCETQAKRRVTLSICGLGMLDESEIEDLPKERLNFKFDKPKTNISVIQNDPIKEDINKRDLEQDLLDISQCNSLEELQSVYTNAYKHFVAIKDKESLDKLIKAKDKKKESIDKNIALVKEFNQEIDSVTGEVLINV